MQQQYIDVGGVALFMYLKKIFIVTYGVQNAKKATFRGSR